MRQILENLSDRSLRAPDETAVIQELGATKPRVFTVADLVRSALAFHSILLRERWSSPVVPILAVRSTHCLAMMMGAALAGRAFACLNLRLKPVQIETILRKCGGARLVCDAQGERLLRRAATEETHHDTLVVPDGVEAGADDTSGNARRLAELASNLDGSAPACCLFTSGSTGEPKGVLISGDDLYRRADAEVACYEISGADRLLNVLPFAFDVGLNQALTSLLTGAPLVISESWLPKDLLGAIQKFGVTGVSGVPAVWRDLCRSGLQIDSAGAHKTLRYVTVSGGSLAPVEFEALRKVAAGIDIFKTYGQTETFRSTILFPRDLDQKAESVGRAFPGVCLRTVDEDGRVCAVNQVGEVVHSGIGVMLGYLDGPSEDEKRRHNPYSRDANDSPFAIWTGDLGYMDEQGFLYLKGRRDGMLKVGGNRFYPDEVAAALLTLAGVHEVEVVGLQSGVVETTVAAFVVADDGVWTPEALRRAVGQRLASYMVPASITMLAAMPRLPNGKPDRVRLREIAHETSAP